MLGLFLAVILHEVSHGWIALQLGDPTAKKQGRLTLNPIPHIDPVGTILIPLTLVLFQLVTNMGFFIFGWAKPVPIDPSYFRDPDRGMLWVGLAGPMTNILMFSVAAFLGRLILPFYVNNFLGKGGTFLFELAKTGLDTLIYFLGIFAIINTILAAFNLLPIPPLDGSRVLRYFLPYEGKKFLSQLEPYGFLIILALIWLGGLEGFFSLLQRFWGFALGNVWLKLIFI